MKLAFRVSTFLLAWTLFAVSVLRAAESQPLQVVIAGLVHGHVEGFLSNSLHPTEILIVGIIDPDRSLFDLYAFLGDEGNSRESLRSGRVRSAVHNPELHSPDQLS